MGIPDVEKYWKSIGAQLTLRTHTLDSIERKYPRSLIRCKREMFKEALDTGLTWKDVLDALSELPLLSVVKKVCEAMEIEYEYGSSSQTLLPVSKDLVKGLKVNSATFKPFFGLVIEILQSYPSQFVASILGQYFAEIDERGLYRSKWKGVVCCVEIFTS